MVREIKRNVMVSPETDICCPSVLGWPEDDFAAWVASHREEVKSIMCSQTEYFRETFCEPDDIDDLGIG